MKDEQTISSTHDEKVERASESPPRAEHVHDAKERDSIYDIEGRSRTQVTAVFENPLAGIPREQLFEDVDKFCVQYGLQEYQEVFRKGALVSQNPHAAQDLPELNEEEKKFLEREVTHKWSQPWQLYFMACKLSLCPVSLGVS